MRILLLLVAALVVLLPLVVWLGSQFGLDRSRAHARTTAALPLYDGGALAESTLVRIAARGMEFRARVAGLGGEGRALILLHGFPETSIMWEPLIERAAAAGYRVVAFDQRGYSPGARPEGLDAYRMPELVEDVLAIADAVGFDRFHLVGHDWGAIVGWVATGVRPDRILSWASLSIPHPASIPEPDVPSKTPAYVKVFRVPGLAEALLGFAGRVPMHRVIWGTMSWEHHEEYEAVYSEPGALTATLNWYRAMEFEGPPPGDLPRIAQPVLYIYGKSDIAAFVNDRVQGRLLQYIEGPFERIALDAGHWLIQDEEKVVVDSVMEHLESVR